ncbi:MAG TPA: GNAT family N-acetyltransferase [Deinococcales bacterium]|nr:GNAT family N-acetyltransferase [Deinococcales bacterium]
MVAEGERFERRRFGAGSNDHQPAGAALLRRLGARPGLDVHTNHLDLAGLDTSLLERWTGEARKGAPGYEVFTLRGEWPPDLRPALVELTHVMNTAPTGSLAVEPHELTPEQVLEYDRQRAALGVVRFTAVARHVPTGELVGYTELSRDAGRPFMGVQGDTAVRPEHRGHGLGRWLKAVNLLAFLEDPAGARFVRTYNADSNGPMLAINLEMGFRRYLARTEWQFDGASVPQAARELETSAS